MNKNLRRALYPLAELAGFTEVDGTVLFYNVINSRLKPGAVVVDFGAGRGLAAEDGCEWRRNLATLSHFTLRRIAVDVDPVVEQNQLAAERHVMEIVNGRVRIPVADASVDVIICDWVVEHLPDPTVTFSEFHRALRPGGTLAIRTSNQWHYAYIIARLLGESPLGSRALRRAQPNRKEEDVFPKLYRANSLGLIRRALRTAGFTQQAAFTWDPEPAYVGSSFLGGVIGFVLHRVALLGLLPRSTLLGFAVK